MSSNEPAYYELYLINRKKKGLHQSNIISSVISPLSLYLQKLAPEHAKVVSQLSSHLV